MAPAKQRADHVGVLAARFRPTSVITSAEGSAGLTAAMQLSGGSRALAAPPLTDTVGSTSAAFSVASLSVLAVVVTGVAQPASKPCGWARLRSTRYSTEPTRREPTSWALMPSV